MLDGRPVRGFWRRLRSGSNTLLIAILLAIPWIELAGEPLLRLDVPRRQFHVFGLVIFPQELFLLWLIVIGLAIALFFFTALAGRLWCGWACPQTVISDVFAGIARRIQGWSTRKPKHIATWRVALTHAAWIALSVVIGFHLVAYFHSPYEMIAEFSHGEITARTAGFLFVGSTISYVDFGLVRQTFCKYLCPYARFQGVLFDSDTLVIGYDERRGEPRGKRGRVEGDCVDCGLCVDVCPTRIDIRDGLQFDCIACTQCIDACDGVMTKLSRPTGLIAYRSLKSLQGSGRPRILRPRVVVYAALLLLIGAGFATSVARRIPLDLQVARNRSALYQQMPDGRIGNAYTLHMQNRGRKPHSYRIGLDAPPSFALIAGVNPVELPATGQRELRVFVVADRDNLGPAGPRPIGFWLEQVDDTSRRVTRQATFVFPAPTSTSGE